MDSVLILLYDSRSCLSADLGTMIADVMHPDLVSLQPCCGVEDFMDTVEAPPLRTGRVLSLHSAAVCALAQS